MGTNGSLVTSVPTTIKIRKIVTRNFFYLSIKILSSFRNNSHVIQHKVVTTKNLTESLKPTETHERFLGSSNWINV